MDKRGRGRERKLQQEGERERERKEGDIDRKRKEEGKKLGIQTEKKNFVLMLFINFYLMLDPPVSLMQ